MSVLLTNASHSLSAWWLHWLRATWFKRIGPQIERSVVACLVGLTVLPIVKRYLTSEYHEPFYMVRKAWRWLKDKVTRG